MRTTIDVEIEQMVGKRTPFKTAVSLFKARYLRRALDLFEDDKDQTAKALGMDRDDLRKKMKKYNVHSAKTSGNGSNGKSRRKYS